MHVLYGDTLTRSTQSAVSQMSLSSVIENKNITSYNYSQHGMRLVQWLRNEAEMQRHYSTIWLLLPIGSILITAIVILLMVMFNRCPQMIAAIVTGILGVIIVFIIVASLNPKPVYS